MFNKQFQTLNIIPIVHNSKKPALKWEVYNHLKYPRQELEGWQGNFAAICGKSSSHLVVVDFDSPQLYDKFFSDIPTLTIKTPSGGYHLYFYDSHITKKYPKYRGYPIDVQSNGSYVLIPPSVIGDSKYEIYKDSDIQKADVKSLLDSRLPLGEERPTDVEQFRNLISLTDVIKQYVTPAYNTKGYWQSLCCFHEERLPSLTIYKDRYYCFGCGATGDVINFIIEMEHLPFREAIAFLSKEYNLPSPLGRRSRRKYFNEDGKPIYEAFVAGSLEEYRFVTAYDNEQLYWYSDGYYREGAEVRVKEWVESVFKDYGYPSKIAFVAEVVAAIKRRTYVDRSQFNPIGTLNLVNGILDVQTLEVTQHSPDLIYLYQLPVRFDKKAKTPYFETFLNEICAPEAVEVICRMFGYCLLPNNLYQKAFLLVGNGCNGKTTLLNVLIALLGKQNVTSESLQALATGRFSVSSLYGKLANICADIPDKPLDYTGTFKMLTGGDIIRGEKKYQNSFEFVNSAKLIFAANKLPIVNDTAPAFWRRWVILEFPNSFEGRENYHLLQKLSLELSGILNFALRGLVLLRVDDGFATSQTMGEVMETWKKNSDSIYYFVGSTLKVRGGGDVIIKEQLYSAYCNFCDDESLLPFPQNEFAKRLPQSIRVRAVRRTMDGRVQPCWEGIGFKND